MTTITTILKGTAAIPLAFCAGAASAQESDLPLLEGKTIGISAVGTDHH